MIDQNAYEHLIDYLKEGEVIKAVVISDTGFYEAMQSGFFDRILTCEEAATMMVKFPAEYFLRNFALYVWTDTRVISVMECGRGEFLMGVPRNPVDGKIEWE